MDKLILKYNYDQNPAETPFGVVPLLEHNGKQVGQSIAIARYLAKKVKLAGNDDWEDLEIDAVIDTVHDLYQSTKILLSLNNF